MIAICITYALRFVLSMLFKIRFPEGGDLWNFPGFYSLTIPYGNSNDYYFNPVIAVSIQLFHEFKTIGKSSLMWLSLLALIANNYLSITLKGHYSIDNFGGFVIGHYIWIVTDNWISYFVDVKLFGMTIHERFPGTEIKTACQSCGTEINEWVQLNNEEEVTA